MIQPWKDMLVSMVGTERGEEPITRVVSHEEWLRQETEPQLRENWRGSLSKEGRQMQGTV